MLASASVSVRTRLARPASPTPSSGRTGVMNRTRYMATPDSSTPMGTDKRVAVTRETSETTISKPRLMVGQARGHPPSGNRTPSTQGIPQINLAAVLPGTARVLESPPTAALEITMQGHHLNEKEYRKRIIAWCMYDWANSAFATTILAAVLPVYYSQVAGATLPSEARATAYWSTTISVSLLIAAVVSPVLGTLSDIVRAKKRFLALFIGLGVIGTGLLVLVDSGDWLLASILFLVGRVGFTAANVFYDALLPHVARQDDRDTVSARGYAFGYLGGGILLAANVAMIQLLPGTWGPRLSFLSVALWWAIFSVPVLTSVPEPPAAHVALAAGRRVLTASFRRILSTLRDIRHYRELFKFLLAFLIYNDGIGTIISISAIYGAELGFGSVELVLALLLVQFVGIPFSLLFGRLPDNSDRRRPVFLALIVYNVVTLPLAGLIGVRSLPAAVTGGPLPPYGNTSRAVGQGIYDATDAAFQFAGAWETISIPADEVRSGIDEGYARSWDPRAQYDLAFNGQEVQLSYSTGPDHGTWSVSIDGSPYIDPDSSQPLMINAYSRTKRYAVRKTLRAGFPGEHILSVANTDNRDARSSGAMMTLGHAEVRPPERRSNLPVVVGFITLLEALGIVFALAVGRRLFSRVVARLDTRTSIIVSLVVYAVISIWGYFLNSVIEFWLLAWMVAMVQGGSQALSRSLYASMSPAAKSGEFFGLYGIMEKFSAVLGPLLFAAAATAFDSSRPAVLSLIAFFFIGIVILAKVDIDKGKAVAQAEDRKILGNDA
jgi:UMF1 family MFS transporter